MGTPKDKQKQELERLNLLLDEMMEEFDSPEHEQELEAMEQSLTEYKQ